ncbi:hypothetical protein [Streptomyces sp. NPDC023838]|uniref:hypothetical protein n=1 Tax=Streptomyces sp. NPDC023838 TaxID=3154325 RepID=UPI00340DD0D3
MKLPLDRGHLGDWDLEVPEEIAPGGKQVHEAVHRGVKRDAIALVDLGQDGTAVAQWELGISSEALAAGTAGRGGPGRGGESGELTSAEREELKRLRKKVREQQQTIEIVN